MLPTGRIAVSSSRSGPLPSFLPMLRWVFWTLHASCRTTIVTQPLCTVRRRVYLRSTMPREMASRLYVARRSTLDAHRIGGPPDRERTSFPASVGILLRHPHEDGSAPVCLVTVPPHPMAVSLPALTENARVRYVAFGLLYVAQGIPEGMIFFALPAYLAVQGVEASAIAAFVSVSLLPWTFKGLDGPLMDRFTFLPMGRRRRSRSRRADRVYHALPAPRAGTARRAPAALDRRRRLARGSSPPTRRMARHRR